MDTREYVRKVYGRVGRGERGCCEPAGVKDVCKGAYTGTELGAIPRGSDLGLGSGNPVALAELKAGETVLDLGSGAGIDCFLAAKKVGRKGRVIGVDMTPEMVARARKNAVKGGYTNVEFRLGEIESLPVADETIDVAISNCVINLSIDKPRALSEVYRVLKPGGRISISDVALIGELPEKILRSLKAYAGCVAGALKVEEYERLVKEAGFKDVTLKTTEPGLSSCCGPGAGFSSGRIVSVSITGHK